MRRLRSVLGRRWVPYTVATCSAVLLYLIFAHIHGLLAAIGGIFRFISPVFWGAILAYIIDALVVLYERAFFRRAKRPRAARRVAIILAIATILLLVALFLSALVPQLVTSVSALIGNLGYYAASLRDLLETVDVEIAGVTIDLSTFTEFGNRLLQNLTVLVQDNIGRIINTSYTIGKGFVNTVITFILAVYFLLDKERLLHVAKKLLQARLTPARYPRAVRFLRRCNRILIRFIACDLLDALIVAVVNFIFMRIAGLPYMLLLSVVVGAANLVPTFGPIAGGVIGALILLLVQPQGVLAFVIFTVILQTVDGYILKPNLYGDSLGVSSLWVLAAIVVGGRMFGAAGVLLAIPFAAISDFFFREYLWPRMTARRPAEAAEPAPAAPPDPPPEK